LACKYAAAFAIFVIGLAIAFSITMKALQHYQKYLTLIF
jgi:hypothetical protein